MEDEISPAERPYRSHLRPACLPCRTRRSRCKVDLTQSQVCQMCQFHGTQCRFPEKSTQANKTSTLKARRQRKSKQSTVAGRTNAEVDQRNLLGGNHNSAQEKKIPDETPFPNPALAQIEHELHIIGPVQNSDAQPIAEFLANDHGADVRAATTVGSTPIDTVAGQRSVSFRAVRRRPFGTVLGQTKTSIRCQTIEKIIEPFGTEILELYFEKLSPCFPLLEAETFMAKYANAKDEISHALLSSLFAQSMAFWRQFRDQQGKYCPDYRFIWNQANEALHSDLHFSPGISTIVAVLLNVSGRPLTSMIGNGVILGSAISVAHSLGLNRDPFPGDLTLAEKQLRMRVWWALVVLDKWSSVAYGIPPIIRRTRYDVPLPTFGRLSSGGKVDHLALKPSFVGLVYLSEILDLYLEQIFDLERMSEAPVQSNKSNLQAAITKWGRSLPRDLQRAVLQGTDSNIPGAPNLRLSYLYMKLLLAKMDLDSDESAQRDYSRPSQTYYAGVLQAAREIVLFIQALDKKALGDFWLSTNSFSLAHTVACLLRCALVMENGPEATVDAPLCAAHDMIGALQKHRRDWGWDIGNICLGQYSGVVERMRNTGTDFATQLEDVGLDFGDFDFSALDWSFQTWGEGFENQC